MELLNRQGVKGTGVTAESVNGRDPQNDARSDEAYTHQCPMPGASENVDPAVSHTNTDWHEFWRRPVGKRPRIRAICMLAAFTCYGDFQLLYILVSVSM